jgi:hypothetical protein
MTELNTTMNVSDLNNNDNVTHNSNNTTNTTLNKYTLMTDDEFNVNHSATIRNPVFHYLTEPKGSTFENAKRIITLVLTYNKSTGYVYYAASHFTRTNESEIFIKRNNKNTALDRFKVRPAGIIIEPNDNLRIEDVAKIVRYAMLKHGVVGKHRNNEASILVKKKNIENKRKAQEKYNEKKNKTVQEK